MDLGLPPQETEQALLRLEERGEVGQARAGWQPRVRPHDAMRVAAREKAARGLWGVAEERTRWDSNPRSQA